MQRRHHRTLHGSSKPVVLGTERGDLSIKLKCHGGQLLIELLPHGKNRVFEHPDLVPKPVHVVFGLRVAFRGPFDMTQQLRFVPLELFVVEAHVGGRACVKVGRQDRFCLELAEAVEIQLSCEGREVGVFEVLRQDCGGELFHVFYYEVIAIF